MCCGLGRAGLALSVSLTRRTSVQRVMTHCVHSDAPDRHDRKGKCGAPERQRHGCACGDRAVDSSRRSIGERLRDYRLRNYPRLLKATEGHDLHLRRSTAARLRSLFSCQSLIHERSKGEKQGNVKGMRWARCYLCHALRERAWGLFCLLCQPAWPPYRQHLPPPAR